MCLGPLRWAFGGKLKIHFEKVYRVVPYHEGPCNRKTMLMSKMAVVKINQLHNFGRLLFQTGF